MKNFKDYLAESRRTYNYRIKIAFKPDNDLVDKIEKALGRYDLVSLSKPKSLPIKKIDSDFVGINYPETYSMDAVVNYPANSDSIRHTLTQIGMDLEQVHVVSTDHDDSVTKENDEVDENTSDKALLDKEYNKDDNKKITDDNFGSAYNDKLVKNSVTGNTNGGVKSPQGKAETTNELPQGKLSPVGSKQNKIPKVKSFAH